MIDLYCIGSEYGKCELISADFDALRTKFDGNDIIYKLDPRFNGIFDYTDEREEIWLPYDGEFIDNDHMYNLYKEGTLIERREMDYIKDENVVNYNILDI